MSGPLSIATETLLSETRFFRCPSIMGHSDSEITGLWTLELSAASGPPLNATDKVIVSSCPQNMRRGRISKKEPPHICDEQRDHGAKRWSLTISGIGSLLALTHRLDLMWLAI
ncbi:hypothetical protein AX15_000459 [Amanita polypyramis BW_CC]|nr:hypothetical protein AX15_000459 [Amanita polypyramis BW_CC]